MASPQQIGFFESRTAEPEAQIYSQFLNFFRLELSGIGTPDHGITLFRRRSDDEIPQGSSLGHDGFIVVAEAKEGYEEFRPDARLLKRVVLRLFGNRLKTLGFRLRPNYIVFHPKDEISHPHRDIFSLFSGFEYRIQCFDGSFFLILDPHLVFSLNTTLKQLIDLGLPLEFAHTLACRVIATGEGSRKTGIDAYIISVQFLNGSTRCQVRNFRDFAQQEVDADRVILEARPEIIEEILQRIGRRFEVIRLQREMSFLSSSKASADRFAKTVEFVQGLSRGPAAVFPIQEGLLHVELARTPLPIRGSGFAQGITIEEPSLLFDRSDSSSTHKQAYWGLRNFGPYQKDMPEIRLALLGSSSEMARIESLVADLNKGTQSMPGGMRRFFRTDLRVVHRIVVSNYELKHLELTLEAFLQSTVSGSVDTVLALLPCKTDEFRLETPYYTIKAVLAKKGITSQMVTPSCFTNLKWNALNIGTALFAKAGGTPWVVEKAFPDVDMIVGFALSTVISRTRRAGNNPKFIGCANVFDSNGRWMFFAGTECEHVAENRVEQIGELFRAALLKYRAEKGVPPKRVAIHYYKRFGRHEKQVIHELLRDAVPDCRVAFITIDDSHPYRAYDRLNKDGDFARGGLVRLGER